MLVPPIMAGIIFANIERVCSGELTHFSGSYSRVFATMLEKVTIMCEFERQQRSEKNRIGHQSIAEHEKQKIQDHCCVGWKRLGHESFLQRTIAQKMPNEPVT